MIYTFAIFQQYRRKILKVHHFQYVHESDRNPPIIQNIQNIELSQYKEISIIYDYIWNIQTI